MSEIMNVPGADVAFGGGVGLSMGLVIPFSNTNPYSFELQPSIGYRFQERKNGNDSIEFSSIPVDLVYFVTNRQEKFRFGYGLTYQVGNRLRGQGLFAGVTSEVPNALGSVVTIEKFFDHTMSSIGLRFVSIRYNSDVFLREADGSSLFLTLTMSELPGSRRIFD